MDILEIDRDQLLSYDLEQFFDKELEEYKKAMQYTQEPNE